MNPVLALIITNVIWGAAPPIFKLALTNIPPFTLGFLRFFLAAIMFLPLIMMLKQKITLKDYGEIFLGSLLGITLHISLFFLGLQRTESINVSIIASSGPIFLYILSILFLKEKPRLKVFLGMMIGLGGVMVIILSPVFWGPTRLANPQIIGNIFILLSTLCLSLEVLIFKNVLHRVRALNVTFWSFLFASLTFLPFMYVELQTWSLTSLNMNGVLGIVFGAVFSSAIAFCLYNYGMGKIQGQEIGIFAYIDPVVTVLIAAPLLGEHPNALYIVGAILVFGGIFIAENRLHWHPFHKLIK